MGGMEEGHATAPDGGLLEMRAMVPDKEQMSDVYGQPAPQAGQQKKKKKGEEEEVLRKPWKFLGRKSEDGVWSGSEATQVCGWLLISWCPGASNHAAFAVGTVPWCF